MRTVNVDKKIITKLRESGISDEMKSLELCDWLVIHEEEGKVVGAGASNGIFHETMVQIIKNFRSQGIGSRIYTEIVKEVKKRNYSCLTVVLVSDPSKKRDEQEVRLKKLINHNKRSHGDNLSLVLRIHFSKEKILHIYFVAWNKKGKIIEKFFRFFNSWFGMLILACVLKISKPLYPKLLGHFVDDGQYVLKPSITWIMKNFTKI